MNQYGCRDTAYIPVDIGPGFVFYIPNAFSPANDDGINDLFTGFGVGIAEYEMWIFDRWGERLYYSNDIYKGWDGKVQGKTGDAKDDVYVWKVKLKDVLGKKHDYVGHVTLLK
jgi:gliding motility-associated-like protein